jgi:FkbH-like protein
MTATVKCLVWDLDDTIWDGVVLEGDGNPPKHTALHALRVLDMRGILHAVASRGDFDVATAHLRKHGLEELFSEIHIGWEPKSAAVRWIAESLNINPNAIAFVDNDPVERAEVAAALPQVRCYSADELASIPELPDFTPTMVTDEACRRRERYRVERRRRTSEQTFSGSDAEFLASLELVMTVRSAAEADLARAHELTVRTNQLNTTGRTFDIDELRSFSTSECHDVLVASLCDRFGDYGTIGLAVSEYRGDDSVLLLLLMSCRVMSRGVGGALIQFVVDRARHRGTRPVAEFVPTETNRVMLVTLRFAGFDAVESGSDRIMLAHNGIQRVPNTGHVRVQEPGQITSR